MDVDDTWIYLNLKWVFIITKYKNNAIFNNNIKLSIFTYTNKDYLILLNN